MLVEPSPLNGSCFPSICDDLILSTSMSLFPTSSNSLEAASSSVGKISYDLITLDHRILLDLLILHR